MQRAAEKRLGTRWLSCNPRRAPCGARLHLHNDVTGIQQPQDGQPEPDEAESPEHRPQLVRKERLEKELIARLLRWHELAADIYFDQRDDESRHDARSDEGDQRIDTVHDER